MADILKINTWMNEDCTLGRLSYGAFRCFTLELPWLDNAKNISCIPAGIYECVKYDSPKHGDVILIMDVPGRSMIEVHSGNFTRQILGCILVGNSIKHLDGDGTPDVTNSKATMLSLFSVLPDAFELDIRRS